MRIEALRSYHILDTAPHPAFDAITRAASQGFNAPIAAISLVDCDRQWFKSSIGLEACETPRDVSFCHHVVGAFAPLVVEDARAHPAFSTNPMVTDDPHIRFYAGTPIIDHEGFALGTVCVIDLEPRAVSEAHLDLLKSLAECAMTAITAHHQGRLLRKAARIVDSCGRCEPEFI